MLLSEESRLQKIGLHELFGLFLISGIFIWCGYIYADFIYRIVLCYAKMLIVNVQLFLPTFIAN